MAPGNVAEHSTSTDHLRHYSVLSTGASLSRFTKIVRWTLTLYRLQAAVSIDGANQTGFPKEKLVELMLDMTALGLRSIDLESPDFVGVLVESMGNYAAPNPSVCVALF